MRANRFASRFLIFAFLVSPSAGALSAEAQSRPGFKELLQQGFALHQQRRYSEALPLLRQAWKIEPHDYFANLLIGIDLVRTGERAQALGFLKTAAKLRPEEEFPPEYLGEAQAGLKQYAEASRSYMQAGKAAPDSSQAAVAMVDYSLARFAQISSQLRSSKQGLAAEFRLEALSHGLKDEDRAKLLRRSVELDGTDAEAWSDLALADLATGNRAVVEIDLQRSLQLDSNCLAAWLVQALLAAQEGDWKAAAGHLNRIAERSPRILAKAVGKWPRSLQPVVPVYGSAATFLNCVREDCGEDRLGGQLAAKSTAARVPSAVAFRDQRWELASLPAPARNAKGLWFKRGSAFAHLGDCERATVLLESALTVEPQNIPALFFLSQCYAQLAGEAEKRLRRAGGEEAVLRNMRGDVLLRLQANSQGAISEYQAALLQHPGDPRTLEHLAEAQFAAGENDAARASAQAALAEDPHRSSAQRTLTRIAMQGRDYETALPLLRELAARDPHDLAIRVDLATALAQTGASAEALQKLTLPLQAGYPDEKGTLHYLLGTILRDLHRMAEANEAFATARQLSDAYQQTSRGDHDAK